MARRRGHVPTPEVVDTLYQLLLGRAPDADGRAHHTDALARGRPVREVAAEIASSPEAAAGLARSPVVQALQEVLWAARDPLTERPLYVLHIMKTGGTSLVTALAGLVAPRPCLTDVFLDHLVSVPRYVLERVPLVAGHLGYEGRALLPTHFATCTVLRDPVERTLSHYAHLRRDPEVHTECPDFSLESFVHSPRWRPLCENYQTRQLAHEIGLGRAWVEYRPGDRMAELGAPFPPDHPLPLQSFFDSSPLSVPPGELLATARRHLDAIELVGVTERLGPLFERLVDRWGLPAPPPLPRLQVGEDRPPVESVPLGLRAAIDEATQVDRALYEEACRRAPG